MKANTFFEINNIDEVLIIHKKYKDNIFDSLQDLLNAYYRGLRLCVCDNYNNIFFANENFIVNSLIDYTQVDNHLINTKTAIQ